jgi:hypothetical protein
MKIHLLSIPCLAHVIQLSLKQLQGVQGVRVKNIEASGYSGEGLKSRAARNFLDESKKMNNKNKN